MSILFCFMSILFVYKTIRALSEVCVLHSVIWTTAGRFDSRCNTRETLPLDSLIAVVIRENPAAADGMMIWFKNTSQSEEPIFNIWSPRSHALWGAINNAEDGDERMNGTSNIKTFLMKSATDKIRKFSLGTLNDAFLWSE